MSDYKDLLHAAIMNLPCNIPSDGWGAVQRSGYKEGHRDARHAAAELVVVTPLPLREEQEAAPLRLYWRSLCDHPGLAAGFLWPVGLLWAVAGRKDFIGFAALSGAAWTGLALLALLPWVAILWTAWTGRDQYKEGT